jgi:hypothetical protein
MKTVAMKWMPLLCTALAAGCLDADAQQKAASLAAPAAQQKAGAAPSARAAAFNAREFTCDRTAVTAETALRPVAGADGESLAVAPTGEPCTYHLLYRDAHGGVQRLTDKPALTIIAHAQRFADTGNVQTRVVCASPMDHRASSTKSTDSTLANRILQGAQLLCTTDRGAGFAKLAKLVDGGNDYAAWIVDLAAVPVPAAAHDGDDDGDDDGKADLRAFAATWVRDSSFQFFNLSDAGRPATDGVYQTTFTVDARGKVRAGATIKLSSSIATSSSTTL